MPTNTSEADIAVLKAEMRDARKDVTEIKTMITDSTKEQQVMLRTTADDLRGIFANHSKECREDKAHESRAREGIYNRLNTVERELATVNLRFDIKRDWLKLLIALAMLALAILSAYREFGG